MPGCDALTPDFFSSSHEPAASPVPLGKAEGEQGAVRGVSIHSWLPTYGFCFHGFQVPPAPVLSASPGGPGHNSGVIDNVRADGGDGGRLPGLPRDAAEIKADGPIASSLCVAASASVCGVMDHYGPLCANTNML